MLIRSSAGAVLSILGRLTFDSCYRIDREREEATEWVKRELIEPGKIFENRARDTIMQSIRIVAIPSEIANEVRETLRAPKYGFPAHAEIAADEAPCRHCLRSFVPGRDRRILFTYDRFNGVESLPQPGPIYIHADACNRYSEDAGFPEELRGSSRTVEAYLKGRHLLAQQIVSDGKFETVIEKLFAIPGVDYLQVNSTTAGCFTFRIKRAPENGTASSIDKN